VSTEKQLREQYPSGSLGRQQPPQGESLPTTTIQPTQGWAPIKLKELFEFRELLYFLIWSDLKVRYKQTVLGAAWAIIQPLAVMVVFAVFFGLVVRVPTGEIPYPIFAYSGLVVWTYFANSLSRASDSILDHESLITKVYFPRLLIPVAAVMAGLVDFAIAFAVLVALVISYGFVPTAAVLTLPLFVLLAVMTALAVSLWLSALNAQYRDIRFLVPVLVQLWFFSTPIIYPTDLIPEGWRTLYEVLNPMVGVVESFRWALLGTGEPPSITLLISVVMVTAIFVSGLYYFRKMEKIFADVV
jgi:lipopolysaccharide transport system permease protein